MAYLQTSTGLKLRGDIKFFYSLPPGYAPADVNFDGDINDVVSDPGLETAILISLFSDQRAGNDDVLPDMSDDRRGWWADSLNGFAIGSKLWLLSREKTNANLVAKLEEYTKNALKWLIDDGIAKSVTVKAVRVSNYNYRTGISLTRSATQDIKFTYYYNWLAQTIGGTNVNNTTNA